MKTPPYSILQVRVDHNIFRQYSTFFGNIQHDSAISGIILQYLAFFGNIRHLLEIRQYSTQFTFLLNNVEKCHIPQFSLSNYVADVEKSHGPLCGGGLFINPLLQPSQEYLILGSHLTLLLCSYFQPCFPTENSLSFVHQLSSKIFKKENPKNDNLKFLTPQNLYCCNNASNVILCVKNQSPHKTNVYINLYIKLSKI